MWNIAYIFAVFMVAKQVSSLFHHETFYLPSPSELVDMPVGAFSDLDLLAPKDPTNQFRNSLDGIAIFFAGCDNNGTKWFISYFHRNDSMLHLFMLQGDVLRKIGTLEAIVRTNEQYPLQAYVPSTGSFYLLSPGGLERINTHDGFQKLDYWPIERLPADFHNGFSLGNKLRVSEDETVVFLAKMPHNRSSWCIYDRQDNSFKERCRQDNPPSTFELRQCMDMNVDFELNKLTVFFSNEHQIINISSKNVDDNQNKIKKHPLDCSFSNYFFTDNNRGIAVKICPNKVEILDINKDITLFEEIIEFRHIEAVDFDPNNKMLRVLRKKGAHYIIEDFGLSQSATKSARNALNEE